MKLRREKKGALASKHFLPRRKLENRKRVPDIVKPRFRAVRILALLLWLLFLGTVGYVLFASPFLMIDRVTSGGGETATREKIEEFFWKETDGRFWKLFPRRNFFFFQPHAFEKQVLHRYPQIRQIRVEKRFPGEVRIGLEERQAMMLWCTKGPCFLLDEQGQVHDARVLEENVPEAVAVYTIVDQSGLPVAFEQDIVPHTFIEHAFLWQRLLPEHIGISIQREMSTPSRFADELRLRTPEGLEIWVSAERDPEAALQALSLFFAQEMPKDEALQKLRYIDLRTEERIYYAPKEPTPETSPQEAEKEQQPDKKKEQKKE
ncbi:MAG: FtsQ-type POTRA domain-containing protein [Candidatus Moraniibacteriota bacterium]